MIDAIRFPSDPDDLLLEENDVAILFRSDELEHVTEGARAVFGELDGLLETTSIRKGFAGGGFIAGLVLACAILVLRIGGGGRPILDPAHLPYQPWIAAGLALVEPHRAACVAEVGVPCCMEQRQQFLHLLARCRWT